MIAWLFETLSPLLAFASVAGALVAAGLAIAGLGAVVASHRRERPAWREVAVAEPVVLCPACGTPSTWDEARRCGCWSGR